MAARTPDGTPEAVGMTTAAVLMERLDLVTRLDGDGTMRVRILAALVAAAALPTNDPDLFIAQVGASARQNLRNHRQQKPR